MLGITFLMFDNGNGYHKQHYRKLRCNFSYLNRQSLSQDLWSYVHFIFKYSQQGMSQSGLARCTNSVLSGEPFGNIWSFLGLFIFTFHTFHADSKLAYFILAGAS